VVVRPSLAEVHEQILPFVPLQELRRFGLDLYVVDSPCLRALVYEPPVTVVAMGARQQVDGVDADEQERELEVVDVALLPRVHWIGEQLPQVLHRQAALDSLLGCHVELPQRVVLRDPVVDCVVEDRTDVAEVYVPGVLAEPLGDEVLSEPAEPFLGDHVEGERLQAGVELPKFLQCTRVQVARACGCAAHGEPLESAGEQVGPLRVGIYALRHDILDLHGRQSRELPRGGERHDQVVDLRLAVLQVGVDGPLVGMVGYLLRDAVPLRREHGDPKRDVRSNTLLGDAELQGLRLACLLVPPVEVESCCCHELFTSISRVFHEFFGTKRPNPVENGTKYVSWETRENRCI